MNKKIYNFTEKQRRKDKSIKIIGMWNAPKDYVEAYNKAFRAQCKRITFRNMVSDLEYTYPIPGRHTAAWDYW